MKIIHHHNNNTMYFSISKSTATGQLLAHFLKKQRDLQTKEVQPNIRLPPQAHPAPHIQITDPTLFVTTHMITITARQAQIIGQALGISIYNLLDANQPALPDKFHRNRLTSTDRFHDIPSLIEVAALGLIEKRAGGTSRHTTIWCVTELGQAAFRAWWENFKQFEQCR